MASLGLILFLALFRALNAQRSIPTDLISENDLTDNEEDDYATDQQDCDDKQSDDGLLLDLTHQQEHPIVQLSAVFQLLQIAPAHDK